MLPCGPDAGQGYATETAISYLFHNLVPLLQRRPAMGLVLPVLIHVDGIARMESREKPVLADKKFRFRGGKDCNNEIGNNLTRL